MLEVMTIAQEAPQRTVDDSNFKQVVESVQKLLGIPNPEIELTQENEEFWNDPEFIAAFDEIDNAIARREQYRAKIAERLTFSLGMTPDEVDSVIRRVQKTATQSNAQSHQMQTEQNATKEPQWPETRMERRKVKATNPLKSPYLAMQIDTKRPWTATEKIIGKWVLQNKSANRTRIIFKHGAYAVIWDDILSLNKNEEIKVGIIDAWSAILNQKEKARSSNSPCRFFASTCVCLYTVVAPYGDDELRSKRFSERMDDEIRLTGGLNLEYIDLFLFPIVHSEHYYVLTINVKNKRFDILDNSSAESPKNEKYGDVPTTLVMLLSKFHIYIIYIYIYQQFN
nr:uncharacterized protein LOC109155335 [Ipomoea batatas]